MSDHQPKFNSTSSVYTSHTLSQPDNGQILFCVSTVLQCQITRDLETASEEAVRLICSAFRLNEFDEEDDEERQALFLRRTLCPTIEEIYTFMRELFMGIQYSPECNIIALIYINRMIATTSLPVSVHCWKQLLVSSISLAQKVWDDRSVSTSDVATVCPFYTRQQLRRFERGLLKLLKYNLGVKPSVYAQYFFELRTVCEREKNEEMVLQPMTKLTADRLELRSSSWIPFKKKQSGSSRNRSPRHRSSRNNDHGGAALSTRSATASAPPTVSKQLSSPTDDVMMDCDTDDDTGEGGGNRSTRRGQGGRGADLQMLDEEVQERDEENVDCPQTVSSSKQEARRRAPSVEAHHISLADIFSPGRHVIS